VTQEPTEDGTDPLIYSTAAGIATIRLNRPHTLNALTSALAVELFPAACRRAQDDPAVRVVVVTGTGRGFCSGADTQERIADVLAAQDPASLRRPVGAFVTPLWQLAKPTIAAVNGVAAGGGMALAAACDFRVVAESATFVAAFVRRGLVPDSGITYLLPRLVGPARAARILMLGQVVTAAEAERIGLADHVVADESLMTATTALARELAEGPAVALSFTKRALQVADESTLERQLEFESWAQLSAFRSADFTEGMTSFAEHRAPVFGRDL
jgi:2-(1,2-epoxy-1,2-dihydrophenyl)acetyl-CoA isomerase